MTKTFLFQNSVCTGSLHLMSTTPSLPPFIGPSNDPRDKAEKGEGHLPGIVDSRFFFFSITASLEYNDMPLRKGEMRRNC